MINELSNEKFMTVKEVAEAMGVSYDTVNNSVKRLFPEIVKNGVKTKLDEVQIACISKELKSNNTVMDRVTFEVSSKVKNTTTELEVLANARNALIALDNLYKMKEAEYKAIIAEKDNQLLEQKPMVDGYQTFLASHNSFTMQKAAAMLKDKSGKSPYGRNNLIKRLKREGILQSNGIPYRPFIDNGYFEVRSVVHNGMSYTTALLFPKGMDYLGKKLGLIVEYEKESA